MNHQKMQHMMESIVSEINFVRAKRNLSQTVKVDVAFKTQSFDFRETIERNLSSIMFKTDTVNMSFAGDIPDNSVILNIDNEIIGISVSVHTR